MKVTIDLRTAWAVVALRPFGPTDFVLDHPEIARHLLAGRQVLVDLSLAKEEERPLLQRTAAAIGALGFLGHEPSEVALTIMGIVQPTTDIGGPTEPAVKSSAPKFAPRPTR